MLLGFNPSSVVLQDTQLYDTLCSNYRGYQAAKRLAHIAGNFWIGDRLFEVLCQNRGYYQFLKSRVSHSVAHFMESRVDQITDALIEKITERVLEEVAARLEAQVREKSQQALGPIIQAVEEKCTAAQQRWGYRMSSFVSALATYSQESYHSLVNSVSSKVSYCYSTTGQVVYSAASTVLTPSQIQICQQTASVLAGMAVELTKQHILAHQEAFLAILEQKLGVKLDEGQKKVVLSACQNCLSEEGSFEKFKGESLCVLEEKFNLKIAQYVQSDTIREGMGILFKTANECLNDGDWSELPKKSKELLLKSMGEQAAALIDGNIANQFFNGLSKKTISLLMQGKHEEAIQAIKKSMVLELKKQIALQLKPTLRPVIKQATLFTIQNVSSSVIDFGIIKTAQVGGLTLATYVGVPVIQSAGELVGVSLSPVTILATPLVAFCVKNVAQHVYSSSTSNKEKEIEENQKVRNLILSTLQDPVKKQIHQTLQMIGYDSESQAFDTSLNFILTATVDQILNSKS